MAKGKKTGGRLPGVKNRITTEFRETVRQLLEDNSANVGTWLDLVARGDADAGVKPDPGKALDLITRLAEYAAPKLSRTEVTGKDGGPMQVTAITRTIIDPKDGA